jgi:hypothetical protein
MLAKKRYKLGIDRWKFSLRPIGRMLFPSLHKNLVTIEKKTIEEQVRCYEKRIFNIYVVQELCHWSWMG